MKFGAAPGGLPTADGEHHHAVCGGNGIADDRRGADSPGRVDFLFRRPPGERRPNNRSGDNCVGGVVFYRRQIRRDTGMDYGRHIYGDDQWRRSDMRRRRVGDDRLGGDWLGGPYGLRAAPRTRFRRGGTTCEQQQRKNDGEKTQTLEHTAIVRKEI